MRYAVVVCTKNRLDSLHRCLSTLESQSEPPARVIVVDAGDDPATTHEATTTGRRRDIEWKVIHSPVQNLALQRNLGVQHVKEDVVLLPDDDSLFFPAAAESLMSVYRSDADWQIAAVSGTGTATSPLEAAAAQIDRRRRFKDRVQPFRSALESRFIKQPFGTFPQSLWVGRDFPAFVSAVGGVLSGFDQRPDGMRVRAVECVAGYLLSLRSNVAKKLKFDETLGYGVGYSLHEDMEFSMRAQRAGYLLVAAADAAVFHDAHPSRRAAGFNYGFCWVANYIYACKRNMPESSRALQVDMPRFLAYKRALYRTRAMTLRDDYSRDIAQGAETAWATRGALLEATDEDSLAAQYRSLCDALIRRN